MYFKYHSELNFKDCLLLVLFFFLIQYFSLHPPKKLFPSSSLNGNLFQPPHFLILIVTLQETHFLILASSPKQPSLILTLDSVPTAVLRAPVSFSVASQWCHCCSILFPMRLLKVLAVSTALWCLCRRPHCHISPATHCPGSLWSMKIPEWKEGCIHPIFLYS